MQELIYCDTINLTNLQITWIISKKISFDF